MMGIDGRNGYSIDFLIEGYKKKFRIPENFNHYSNKDFKKAEIKYIEHRLERDKSRLSPLGDLLRKGTGVRM
jgi:hypothetical protein